MTLCAGLGAACSITTSFATVNADNPPPTDTAPPWAVGNEHCSGMLIGSSIVLTTGYCAFLTQFEVNNDTQNLKRRFDQQTLHVREAANSERAPGHWLGKLGLLFLNGGAIDDGMPRPASYLHESDVGEWRIESDGVNAGAAPVSDDDLRWIYGTVRDIGGLQASYEMAMQLAYGTRFRSRIGTSSPIGALHVHAFYVGDDDSRRPQVAFFRQIRDRLDTGLEPPRAAVDFTHLEYLGTELPARRDVLRGLKLKSWPADREGGKTGDVFVRSRDVDGRGNWTVEYFKLVARDGEGKYEPLPANATNSSHWQYLGTDLPPE
ncbi:hypothetical protein [Roseateles sp.]|uniref:hypothetical protein n=1 Tax=Roseateles sp. TaxID=1971397 RepID=UPI0031CE019A